MGQTNNTRKQPILSRPFIPEGNDFEIMIDMKKADTEEYIDYDLTTCKNIIVYLTCGAHGTEIPLQYTIVDNHKLRCPVHHESLHANTSYGIVVEGDTDDDKHWQYTIMPREGIAIIPNTSGEVIPDGTTTIDIQGRVGFIGAVGPQGPPGTTDYNELENKPDLSIYATKTELDTKQDELESGINIKTINDESILGEGNIEIKGGGSVEPIIVNYNEQIPTETLEKIVEQKSNVMMLSDQNYYYPLLRLSQRSNYTKLDFGIYYVNPSDTRQVTVMMYSYIKYDHNSYGTWEYNFAYLDDDYKIKNLFNEQFKTTADALWDLDHRINKNEYITNKKLESIEDSTKETLNELGYNVNEQLSVTANTFIELLKWKEDMQTTTNEIIEENAWLFNTNNLSTLTATT